jgi:long-subunit fatty acid transport protein
MSDELRFAKNFRMGMEIKPVPQFALRAGYAFYQNPNAASNKHNHIISAGAGFSSKKGFFGDLAVQHKLKTTEDIKLYADYQGIESPEGTFTASGLRVLMTFGFRF